MADKEDVPIDCCYTNCTECSPLDARIEVKTLLPTNGLDKLKPKLLVKWRQNGEAEFHLNCWEMVLELSRKRTKSRTAGSMCKEEKALVKAAAEAPEQYDSIKDILEKAKQAADLIKHAKHCVAFTGAGISTSAGIGDYRGKAGKWTEQDQGTVNMDQVFAVTSKEPAHCKLREPSDVKIGEPASTSLNSEPVKCIKSDVDDEKQDGDQSDDGKDEEEDGVPYETLRPTYTHEALAKLMESGYLKYITSQNGDGLHGLSGIATDKLAELHGNVFKEYCEKCETNYLRKFYVMDDVGSQYFEEVEDSGKSGVKRPRFARKCDLCGLSHRTGRKCEKKGCGGFLRDTIINFRDLLDEYLLDDATIQSEQCDVMVCLGTTLQVTPACDLVKKVKDKNKLIICNRQETPMDEQLRKRTKDGSSRGCRVFGDCDLFMREMMRHIYPQDELSDWEAKRNDRLKQYDNLRDMPE